MTEPTPEAYEAAARAWVERDAPLEAIVFMSKDRLLRTVVEATWPIAEATVRAKVAAEIRADCHHSESVHVCRCYRLAARIAEGKGDKTP